MRGWIKVKGERDCDVCGVPSHNRYSVQYRPASDALVLFTITIARCDEHVPRVSGAGDCLHVDHCRQARKRTA